MGEQQVGAGERRVSVSSHAGLDAGRWLAAAGLAVGLALSLPVPPWAAVLLAVVGSLAWPLWGLSRRGRREEALLVEHVQRVLDALPQPVFIKNAGGRYVACNQAFAEERGMSREALMGVDSASLAMAVRPDIQSMVREEDARVLAGEDVLQEDAAPNPRTGAPRARIYSKRRYLGLRGQPLLVGSYVDITNWRQAEANLKQAVERSEAHFADTMAFVQRVLDQLPYPVFVKDAQGRYLIVNEALAADRGELRDKLIGATSILPGMTPERVQLIQGEDLAVMGGARVHKEERITDPSGKLLDRIVTKSSCLDANGTPVIVVTYVDITEAREAERALHQSIERQWGFMQRMLDIIPVSLYVKDAQSRYLIVNKTLLAQRKRRAEDLVGRAPEEIDADPAVVRKVIEEDQRIINGETVYKEECRPDRDTGEDRFRIISKGSIVDASGAPVIVVANIDITEQRMAERRVREALDSQSRVGEFLQAVFDAQAGPLYVMDAIGNLLMVNRAFAQLLGRRRTDLIGRSAVEMSPPGVAEAVERCQAQLGILGEGRTFETDLEIDRGGQLRHYVLRVADGPGLDGNAVQVGVLSDVTTLREAEAHAQKAVIASEEASRAKSVFLATMSHEIRTPISGVIGTLRLAMREKSLQGTPQDLVSTALSNAQALLGIINDILDFSKIEAGQLTLEKIDFDLRSIIRHSMSAFRDSLADRSLQFVIDIDSTLPPYYLGDPTRLRQVLINLVGNSIKFTSHGQVALRAVKIVNKSDAQTCWVRFRVEDTGIGISQEAIGRLFQKFQQADTTTTRKYGGTGLGLAICKQLVEAMGGQISVSSQEGVGTTFEFSIPLPLGKAPQRTAEGEMVAHSHRLKVLCAEDYPANQLIIRALLESMGHEIELVGDGRAAIEALAKNDYDCVLMDSRMPVMDGLEATRAIRTGGLANARVRRADILIIALTANASTADRTACLEAGMNDYLTKPIDEMRLHEKLGSVIETRLAAGIPLPRQEASGVVLDAQQPANDVPIIEQASAPAKPVLAAVPPPAKPVRPMSARLQKLFFDGLPQQIAELDVAVQALDYPTLARLAHGLKGTVAHFGGAHIQGSAATLESACDKQDSAEVARLHTEVRTALKALLADYVAQQSAAG